MIKGVYISFSNPPLRETQVMCSRSLSLKKLIVLPEEACREEKSKPRKRYGSLQTEYFLGAHQLISMIIIIFPS